MRNNMWNLGQHLLWYRWSCSDVWTWSGHVLPVGCWWKLSAGFRTLILVAIASVHVGYLNENMTLSKEVSPGSIIVLLIMMSWQMGKSTKSCSNRSKPRGNGNTIQTLWSKLADYLLYPTCFKNQSSYIKIVFLCTFIEQKSSFRCEVQRVPWNSWVQAYGTLSVEIFVEW